MMETSDSEYFESADEDFQSDEEDTKTVKSETKSDETSASISIKSATTQLKTAKLTDSRQETDNTNSNNNKICDNSQIDNLRSDDENNFKTCEVERIAKEPVKKVESKLTSKVNANISEEITHEKSEIEEQSHEVNFLIKSPKDLSETLMKKTNSEEENVEVASVKDISQLSVSTKPESDEIKEENLWEEDEIEWGKEKEEGEIEWNKEKEEDNNMWDNDDWEPIEQPVLEQPNSDIKPNLKTETPQENTSSWGSWGNWGVSSILSTATQSVSTITQGITTVLESGIGVPEPEELARINQAEKEKLKELSSKSEDDNTTSFGLGNLVMGVSHLTKLVETTGTKVISGGLDTLETIGKKTMEVLQEGDPGLKKKRAFLKIDQDKPVLSQLLREAKEKAEQENEVLEQKHFKKRAKNYETLFDDHQGLVHLEALEMLSKQCDIKLQTLLESHSDETLTDMQETLDQVKELCELPDEDEDEQANWSEIAEKLNSAVSEINIPISYKKLIDTWEETETWLNNLKLEVCDERELHQQAVETLAQLTAISVEQFHKAGELLLVKEHRSTADEADSLVQLTTSLTSLIGIVAAKFSDKLNSKSSSSKNKETINGLITNVFFEAANSSSYIQDAFQLLVPVLQVGAV